MVMDTPEMAAYRLLGAIVMDDPAIKSRFLPPGEEHGVEGRWSQVAKGLYELEAEGVIVVRVDVRHWINWAGEDQSSEAG
jgi:hypothetical protein